MKLHQLWSDFTLQNNHTCSLISFNHNSKHYFIVNTQQNDLTDIPYNFLISGSGDCYEIRGWNYVSGFTIADIMNTSIAVGLIGNFTSNVPSENQLAELVAFINESIRRKKLSKNFNLYGIRNDSNVHEILNDMEQWSGIL